MRLHVSLGDEAVSRADEREGDDDRELGRGAGKRDAAERGRVDIKVLPIAAAPSRDVVAAWRSWETMPIATRKFIDYMSSHIEG